MARQKTETKPTPKVTVRVTEKVTLDIPIEYDRVGGGYKYQKAKPTWEDLRTFTGAVEANLGTDVSLSVGDSGITAWKTKNVADSSSE